jgi:hypothetical protein
VAGLADPLDVSCLTGHSGAVLSLSYDPKGEYLVRVAINADQLKA